MDQNTAMFLAVGALAVSAYACGFVVGRQSNRLGAQIGHQDGIIGNSEPTGPSNGPLPSPGLYTADMQVRATDSLTIGTWRRIMRKAMAR